MRYVWLLSALCFACGAAAPKAHELAASRTTRTLGPVELAKVDAFVEFGREQLQIPGIAIAITQGEKVIHARGYGVRDLAKPEPVDADTLFMLGSNSKPLTTLLLATLADEGKLRWDQPVVELMPAFAMPDAQSTKTMRVEQLSCMCSGFSRGDLIYKFEHAHNTPLSVMRSLTTLTRVVEPGTFHYSNALGAAAGYVAGYVAAPDQELGEAYDAAMKARVFTPLGMRRSTFDFDAASADLNHAAPHLSSCVAPVTERYPQELNRQFIAGRPAGGLWSTANDLIQYVRMELAGGTSVSGARVVSERNLRKRQQHYASWQGGSYGLGLMVDRGGKTPVVFHRGSVLGNGSWLFWLPEQDVGVVILGNANEVHTLDVKLQQYVQELLLGEPESAWDALRTDIAQTRASSEELRARIRLPPPLELTAKLAGRYQHPELGSLEVTWTPERTVFDFGEWQTAVALLTEDNGEISLLPLLAGFDGVFVIGSEAGRRTIIARDPAYGDSVFAEVPAN